VDIPARFRMSRTALVPVAFFAVCVVPLASAAPWLLVLLLAPLLAAAWVLRVGVDVGADGVTVRSLAGARQVSWREVAGVRVGDRGALHVVTTRGTELRLPVVRARDLPALTAASAGHLPDLGPGTP
jgi:Bacterial PH domain